MAAKRIIRTSVNSEISTTITTSATKVWAALNGVINVYKPAGITTNQVRKSIISNVCKDLNNMEVRPPSQYVEIENTKSGEISVSVRPNYADHPLVVGPRYQIQDVKCTQAAPLGKNTIGVLLLGINKGTSTSTAIHASRPTRAYHLMGRLGEATDSHFSDGKVVEKSTFHNIRRHHIDGLLASMQASHQKKMFELSGVDMESQAAYELAVMRPVRPENRKVPVLYGIKCVQFSSPDFTIEVQCLNEYEQYLITLIHDIGVQLHSVAHCTQLRCIRHGNFDLYGALLRRHWTLQGVIGSMEENNKIIQEHPEMLKQTNANLI